MSTLDESTAAAGDATGADRPRRTVATRWLPGSGLGARSMRIVERNVVAYQKSWMVFVGGLFEPLLYLASIGVGVGALVGDLPGPDGPIPYQTFVAPGLMAASAMNGAVLDTTFNFFVKYKYVGVYEGVLATPLRPRDIAFGEVTWSLLRGGIYAALFFLTMLVLGLVLSPWAVLAIPAAVLIGFAFAGTGLASATFMRSWLDFDLVNAVLLPLFLFSAIFFPIDRYPPVVQWFVQVTPLYQGVALERGLILGDITWYLPLRCLYLVVMGWSTVRLAGTRLGRMLQP